MKYWIGTGIAVALLAFFVLTVDFERMWDALAGADYRYLVPAVVMYLVSVYLRTLRWTVMLRHLKPIRVTRLYPVVVIGYMANNLLPMRLGELVRSYYAGEREDINKASALVTVFVERVFDAVTLLFFIAVVASFFPLSRTANSLSQQSGIPWPLLVAGFSLPFLGALATLVLFALYPERTRSAALWMARPLPRRVSGPLDSLVQMLLAGLTPLKSVRMLGFLFLLSVPIWLTEAAVFWMIGFPFGIDAAHTGPGQMAVTMVLVTAITNIGSSVPLAPAGFGLFEIIARETLVFGPLATIDRSVAAGFALVVHVAIVLPMIILGQVFLWSAHLSLRGLTRGGRVGVRSEK